MSSTSKSNEGKSGEKSNADENSSSEDSDDDEDDDIVGPLPPKATQSDEQSTKYVNSVNNHHLPVFFED